MDWNKIKAEYIAGGTSYRKLAEKYHVSFTTLTRTAQREDWVGLRQQSENRVTTKILDVVSDKKADKALKVVEVADKLLAKIGEVIDIVTTTQDIRHLTSALKDIKDIKGIKSDADMREQEARIRNLEKQAEKQDESNDVTVTIGSDAEEYST